MKNIKVAVRSKKDSFGIIENLKRKHGKILQIVRLEPDFSRKERHARTLKMKTQYAKLSSGTTVLQGG